MYVERLWRSLKQEEVYRYAYETVSEAMKGIADYLATATKNARTRDLTTEPPTTYSSNESRFP